MMMRTMLKRLIKMMIPINPYISLPNSANTFPTSSAGSSGKALSIVSSVTDSVSSATGFASVATLSTVAKSKPMLSSSASIRLIFLMYICFPSKFQYRVDCGIDHHNLSHNPPQIRCLYQSQHSRYSSHWRAPQVCLKEHKP